MNPRALSAGERLAVVLAALSAVGAGWLWAAPFAVPARAGMPFGCGSPARPNTLALARTVCAVGLDSRRVAVACAAVLAVAVLLVVLLARTVLFDTLGRRGLTGGVVLGTALLLTGAAAGVATATTPVEVRSATGDTVVVCGSGVDPTTDSFSRGLCADVPQTRLAAGIALLVAGLVGGAGAGWAAVAGSRPARRPDQPDTPDEAADPQLFPPTRN